MEYNINKQAPPTHTLPSLLSSPSPRPVSSSCRTLSPLPALSPSSGLLLWDLDLLRTQRVTATSLFSLLHVVHHVHVLVCRPAITCTAFHHISLSSLVRPSFPPLSPACISPASFWSHRWRALASAGLRLTCAPPANKKLTYSCTKRVTTEIGCLLGSARGCQVSISRGYVAGSSESFPAKENPRLFEDTPL